MGWSPKRCINFLNKLSEMKDAINELSDDDVEILKLVSEGLGMSKRIREIQIEGGEKVNE